ncbi:hypothetical protein CXB51_013917 [Gossypium anomalum]|uniref:Aminotransferase-like plant mobile domain-containing protein n=1 Tax=Gossypium anomalum TaxID=47600 RepID=A0A8J5YYC3_9ROSI|nr:hypothetical protein CXB51_013917 [Gossypium anomalum]
MGSVVIGEWSGICEQLLGKVPEKFFGGRIELKWLQDNFQDLDGSSSPLEREQHARAYILRLIGGVLMLNKSQALVHLSWLLQLVDLKETSQLNWGLAVLATLYREICWAIQPQKYKICCCVLLLQSWAWFNYHFYVPEPTTLILSHS